MSEGGRGSRVPPESSKDLRTGTSPSGNPRAHASEAAKAESSSGAAKEQRSASQSAAARDQSDHEIQATQAALSALNLSTSSVPVVHSSRPASQEPSASTASTGPRPRAGPSEAAPGGPLAPPSSSSSQTQVVANSPSRTAQLQNPILQKGGATPSARKSTPGPKSVPSAAPIPLSEAAGPRLTQSGRGPLPAAPAVLVGAAGEGRSRALEISGRPGRPRQTTSEPPERSLRKLTTKEKPALQSSGGAGSGSGEGSAPGSRGGAAPHALGGAGPSSGGESSRSLSGVLVRGAASSSTSLRERPAGATPAITTRRTRQSDAAGDKDTGASASESLTLGPIPTTGDSGSSRPGKRGGVWDPVIRSQVYRYATERMPTEEISRKTGVTVATIILWKRQWSLAGDPRLPTPEPGSSTSRNPRPFCPWDEQTRRRVINLLAQDIPQRRVSEITGVPIATITTWKKKESLVQEPARGVKWDQPTRNLAAAFLARNMSVQEISRRLDVPASTIYGWKLYGFPSTSLPLEEESG